MKKTKYIILIMLFSLLFASNIEAKCYKKCANPRVNDDSCEYGLSCESSGSISCEEVSISYCGCDINGDNKINDSDVDIIKEFISSGKSSSTDTLELDCNGDGKINVSDVLSIKKNKSYTQNKVSCGGIKKIPKKIPELTSWAVTFIQVLVPVILVIMSMVDLVKAVSSQKDDEIKKGQKVLIKRIILAAIIFLFVALVKLVISVVASASDTDSITSCIACFIDGDC